MNKTYFFLIIATVMLIIQSCAKVNDSRNDGHTFSNRVVPMATDSKSSDYLLVITIGHTAKDCGGRCVTINDIPYHFDCMGDGNVCNRSVAVCLEQTGTSVTATTTDTFDLTSENFFFMPDRSLYFYTDENNNRVYLNIPEQMVYRDAVTRQFTFTGLFITNTPEYNND